MNKSWSRRATFVHWSVPVCECANVSANVQLCNIDVWVYVKCTCVCQCRCKYLHKHAMWLCKCFCKCANKCVQVCKSSYKAKFKCVRVSMKVSTCFIMLVGKSPLWPLHQVLEICWIASNCFTFTLALSSVLGVFTSLFVSMHVCNVRMQNQYASWWIMPSYFRLKNWAWESYGKYPNILPLLGFHNLNIFMILTYWLQHDN